MKIYMMVAVSCMSLSLFASEASSVKKESNGNEADTKSLEAASIEHITGLVNSVKDGATTLIDKEAKQSKAQLQEMVEFCGLDELGESARTLLPVLAAHHKTRDYVQAVDTLTGKLVALWPEIRALGEKTPDFVLACQEIPEAQALGKKCKRSFALIQLFAQKVQNDYQAHLTSFLRSVGQFGQMASSSTPNTNQPDADPAASSAAIPAQLDALKKQMAEMQALLASMQQK